MLNLPLPVRVVREFVGADPLSGDLFVFRSRRGDRVKLLYWLYGRRAEAFDPNQPLLFPELAEAVPATPPPSAEEEPAKNRRGQSKPHGRKRQLRQLRHEPRRYELSGAERICPDCGEERQEIGLETTAQYEYKPAEVYVIDHQRVKYARKGCRGCVTIALKPPLPLGKALPGQGLLAQVVVDSIRTTSRCIVRSSVSPGLA